jgi:hypothetical protein
MIEVITAFAAGVFLSWPGLLGLALLGILFEHNEATGWAIFTGIVTAILAYFTYSVPLASIAIIAGMYLVIGLLWSFWRYKRLINKVVEDNRDKGDTAKKFALDLVHPKRQLGAITAWIVIWPFSFIGCLAGDLIDAIETLITKVFKGVYNRIYAAALKELGIAPDTPAP